MAGRQGWNLKKENRTFDPISGVDHYAWKGSRVKAKQGRQRARNLYKRLGTCEVCHKAAAVERHHCDGDTLNNERANLLLVCRRCHMQLDGRVEQLVALARQNAEKKVTPPQPCVNCGRPAKPRRKGRCYACDMFFRRHGREWTEDDAGKKPRLAKAILAGETEDPRGN